MDNEFQILKGGDFFKKNFKNKDCVITTFITNEYAEMCLNWFENLKSINLHNDCLIFCFDEKAYEFLKNKKVLSVLIKSNIKMENIEHFSTIKEKFALLVYIIKTLKINLLYSDVDIIFLKNPISRLKEISFEFKHSILINSNNPAKKFYLATNNNNKFEDYYDWAKDIVPQIVNGYSPMNFFYINYVKDYTINFWENLMKNFEQIYKEVQNSNDVFDKNGIAYFFGSTFKKLPEIEFTNFSYMFFDVTKKYVLEKCYILHYNFRDYIKLFYYYIDQKSKNNLNSNIEIENIFFDFPNTSASYNCSLVKEHKIRLMKLNNHWFI